MRVLVLGATGYVGSVVVRHLAAAGHVVVGLVQPGRIVAAGATIAELRYGDLADPESMTAAVTADIDAVINLATPTGIESTDRAAADALLGPLRATTRPFLYTSGTWVLGHTGQGTADEDSPVDPINIVRHRPTIEQQVLATAHHGVRGVVIRPGVVHGLGGGIPALLVDLARQQGIGVYIGHSGARWPMVHVDDLAELFLGALHDAPAGTLLHGVAESAVPVTDLAAAAARAAGVTRDVRGWPEPEAAEVLGEPFAEALALDQAVSGKRARQMLGWQPRQAGAAADLQSGSYAPQQVSA